mgnify:CR=1 FL=1
MTRPRWNIGVMLLVGLLITRFLDVFGNMLRSGVGFIVAGVLLAGLSFALERTRRRLLAGARGCAVTRWLRCGARGAAPLLRGVGRPAAHVASRRRGRVARDRAGRPARSLERALRGAHLRHRLGGTGGMRAAGGDALDAATPVWVRLTPSGDDVPTGEMTAQISEPAECRSHAAGRRPRRGVGRGRARRRPRSRTASSACSSARTIRSAAPRAAQSSPRSRSTTATSRACSA